MKTNHYESVVIFNSSLEDEQIKAAIQRTLETIKSHGGEISEVEDWGRKRLAYPIQKSKSGYYYVMRYVAPPESIAKIERFFFLEEAIIRYLTVKLDKKAIEHYKKKAEEAAKAAQEAPKETSETENENVKD
jgi:small subunit ribosomal protein S6